MTPGRPEELQNIGEHIRALGDRAFAQSLQSIEFLSRITNASTMILARARINAQLIGELREGSTSLVDCAIREGLEGTQAALADVYAALNPGKNLMEAMTGKPTASPDTVSQLEPVEYRPRNVRRSRHIARE